MTREILRELEEGAKDALRDYAALIALPFNVVRSVIARATRTSSQRGADGSRGSSEENTHKH
jgi:hypothetical protein